MLTSGQDCAVSLWTVNGARIGTFGEVGCVVVGGAVRWVLRALGHLGGCVVAGRIMGALRLVL